MKRAVIALVFVLCLLGSVAVSAADAVYEWDFEGASEQSLKQNNEFVLRPKTSRIRLEKLDGSTVLAFRHGVTAESEDCYADLLGGGMEKYGVDPVYTVMYDFRYTGEMTASWQILCSRQLSDGGAVKFQQVGYIKEGGLLALSASAVTVQLEADRWYTVAVSMNETDNVCDIYLDGVLLAEALPFSIDDASAQHAERLRIGFGSGTETCVCFVDNVRVLNAAEPDGLIPADIEVVTELQALPETFALPEYTAELSVSRPVWYAIGTAASLLLAAIGILLLRKWKGKTPENCP